MPIRHWRTRSSRTRTILRSVNEVTRRPARDACTRYLYLNAASTRELLIDVGVLGLPLWQSSRLGVNFRRWRGLFLKVLACEERFQLIASDEHFPADGRLGV